MGGVKIDAISGFPARFPGSWRTSPKRKPRGKTDSCAKRLIFRGFGAVQNVAGQYLVPGTPHRGFFRSFPTGFRAQIPVGSFAGHGIFQSQPALPFWRACAGVGGAGFRRPQNPPPLARGGGPGFGGCKTRPPPLAAMRYSPGSLEIRILARNAKNTKEHSLRNAWVSLGFLANFSETQTPRKKLIPAQNA